MAKPHTYHCNLRERRKMRKMSQRQLSEKTGIRTRMIQRFELGETYIGNATIDTIFTFASALTCPLSALFDDNDPLKEKIEIYEGTMLVMLDKGRRK